MLADTMDEVPWGKLSQAELWFNPPTEEAERLREDLLSEKWDHLDQWRKMVILPALGVNFSPNWPQDYASQPWFNPLIGDKRFPLGWTKERQREALEAMGLRISEWDPRVWEKWLPDATDDAEVREWMVEALEKGLPIGNYQLPPTTPDLWRALVQ